jgi:CheY-like chemotaxis protein
MSHKQVLIVDDDYAVRTTIQFALEATTDWEILTAASGTECLYLAETKPPDLILLDMMMPDLDGMTVLRQLRAKSSTDNIPVILLTAKTLIKEKEKLQDLNVTGVISKPFNAVNLAEQICLLMDWSQNGA